MTLKFSFLGTGDVRQCPVFGCDCPACQRAQQDKRYQRTPCSALLELPEENICLLIDGGQMDLTKRFQPGQLSAIFLTHYHVDHVQGLFHLRWGLNDSIPVFGPDDQTGCADLLKHSGILDFQPALTPFNAMVIGGLRITPIPLQHSKPTFGYLFEHGDEKIAYLTDTVGLPSESTAFLAAYTDLKLVIDCSHPPQPTQPRNHNDLNMVLDIQKTLKLKQLWLTHISHEMDCWLLDNHLPDGILVARDGVSLTDERR